MKVNETKETIIKSALKYLIKKQIEEGGVGFAVDNDHDHDCCWDDVLAWLETQPCEDCISRQAVDDAIYGYSRSCDVNYEQIMEFIDKLPSVTPKYTDEEIDKAQAVEQAYVEKMGKWIEIEIDAGEFIYKCTKCGMRVINPYKYCPNCGAEMSGGREDEDNN